MVDDATLQGVTRNTAEFGNGVAAYENQVQNHLKQKAPSQKVIGLIHPFMESVSSILHWSDRAGASLHSCKVCIIIILITRVPAPQNQSGSH